VGRYGTHDVVREEKNLLETEVTPREPRTVPDRRRNVAPGSRCFPPTSPSETVLQTHQHNTTSGNRTHYTPYLNEAAPHPSGTEFQPPSRRRGRRETDCLQTRLRQWPHAHRWWPERRKEHSAGRRKCHLNTPHTRNKNDETAKTERKRK
jgi:hypothetical protein